MSPFANDAQWNEFTGKAAFTARTLLSIGIALFLSFCFQLQSPMSSVTTVMIVANPTVGALIAKSVWRVIGTFTGAVIGVALMAAFSQAPLLYFMTLSLVVGLTCMVATFLRFFRAYAAVLTGYTIMIVTSSTFYNPDGIFLSAMSRLSAVTVGIVVTSMVFMVTSPRRSSHILSQVAALFHATVEHALEFHSARGNLDQDMSDASQNIDQPTFRGLPQPLYDGREKLLARIASISGGVEYAATDDMEIRARVENLRAGLSGLAGLVAAYHPFWYNDTAAYAASASLHNKMLRILDDIAALTAEASWLDDASAVRGRLREAVDDLNSYETAHPEMSLLVAADNMRDILAQLDRIASDFSARKKVRRDIRLKTHFEWPAAFRNGIRGLSITLIACLIWYIFRWSNGPLFLLFIVAVSSLLSTTPSASRASRPMAIGTLLAIPAGLVCHLFFLPQIDGFPLLWFVIGMFTLPGIWLQFSPRFGLYSFGYVVFFTILLNVSNPIHYDDILLLNNWVAIALASILLVIVFRVVLPPDDRQDAARLVMSLVRSLEHLAKSRRAGSMTWLVWENLQLQKISRLRMRLSLYQGSVNRHDYIDAAHAAISIGRLIVRTRRLCHSQVISSVVGSQIEHALESLQSIRKNPQDVADQIETVAKNLDHPESVLTSRRIAACLFEVVHIIRSVPGFFDRHGPLQLSPEMKCAHLPLSVPVPRLSLFLGMERMQS
ncbi:FUSC family protein [Acetobacter senegalensis]|uniref:FUSC family protein n=1 Tax=Acetobacter senegalensis TaxID=446692 RepID=UPI002653B3BB|nr:FUSC family protein [Acetobacter senegalensis]MDN7356252.1 FUSC family protein [Acetobacter senegalensis]